MTLSKSLARLCQFMGISFAALPRSQAAQFRNMNHKVEKSLSVVQVERMTQRVGAALQQKGYIERGQLESSST